MLKDSEAISNTRTFLERVVKVDPDLSDLDVAIMEGMDRQKSPRLDNMVLAYYMANLVGILEEVAKKCKAPKPRKRRRGQTKPETETEEPQVTEDDPPV